LIYLREQQQQQLQMMEGGVRSDLRDHQLFGDSGRGSFSSSSFVGLRDQQHFEMIEGAMRGSAGRYSTAELSQSLHEHQHQLPLMDDSGRGPSLMGGLAGLREQQQQQLQQLIESRMCSPISNLRHHHQHYPLQFSDDSACRDSASVAGSSGSFSFREEQHRLQLQMLEAAVRGSPTSGNDVMTRLREEQLHLERVVRSASENMTSSEGVLRNLEEMTSALDGQQ
jgi:hypothetical protein